MSTRGFYRIAKYARAPSPSSSNIWTFVSERVVDRTEPDNLPELEAKNSDHVKVIARYKETHQANVFDFDKSWVVVPRWIDAPRPSFLTRLISKLFKL